MVVTKSWIAKYCTMKWNIIGIILEIAIVTSTSVLLTLKVFIAVVGRWRHRLPCQHRWHSTSRQLCRWPRWCRQIPSVGLWSPDDRAYAYIWRSSSQSAQLCRFHATYVGCRKRYQKSHSLLSNSGMKRPDENFCCLCKAPCCRVSLSIYLLLCLLCTDEFLSAKTPALWDGKNWLGLDTDDDIGMFKFVCTPDNLRWKSTAHTTIACFFNSEANVCYMWDLWWVRYLPTRQSTSTPSMQDTQPSGMGDIRTNFVAHVTPNSPDLTDQKWWREKKRRVPLNLKLSFHHHSDTCRCHLVSWLSGKSLKLLPPAVWFWCLIAPNSISAGALLGEFTVLLQIR